MKTRLPIALSLSLLASSAAAGAQHPDAPMPVDSRWLPYLGCWRQLEEIVRDDEVGAFDPEARELVATEGVVVCVTPTSNPLGVTFSTVVEKQASFEETIVADGSPQPISEPGCEGTQRAEWSPNGVRLFATADLQCGDGPRRAISGFTAIGPGAVWIDVQVVSSEGRESVRVRRYRRSSDQTRVADRLSNNRLAAAAAAAAQRSTPFTLDEVKATAAKLPPSALEAALIETNASFPVNAKRLQELGAAGVPPRVIDLVVALSFPNKFVVERETASTSARANTRGGGGGGGSSMPWLYFEDELWPYRYSPFGYGFWEYDYYAYGPPIYVIGGGGGVAPPIAPSQHGRVIDGAGYTQVRARPAEPAATGGSYSGGGDVTAGGVGSSSGGGGGVSTQGYSGGGGGDGGRTAQPRPPK